jgi:hypothetical protein
MKRHVSEITQSANFDGCLSVSQAMSSCVAKSTSHLTWIILHHVVMHICLVHQLVVAAEREARPCQVNRLFLAGVTLACMPEAKATPGDLSRLWPGRR